MVIITSEDKDLYEIAQCHMKAFPKSFSSKLGREYCKEMLGFYISNQRGILFHFESEGEIVGYCGGLKISGQGEPGSATSMTQFTFSSILSHILIKPWLVLEPEIRNNMQFIWRNIKLKISGEKQNNARKGSNDFIPSLGLVVIGVDPAHQGKGYGSVLIREFEERAKSEGFSRVHLSVKNNNTKAIEAYRKNGWSVVKSFHKELQMSKSI